MEMAALLTASVIGCTIQQIAKKAYNKKIEGGTFTFTSLSILFALTVFIAIAVFNGTFNFNSEILPYAIGFAVAYGSASIGSFLAIGTGPLSITSLIVQYSLIIPTIYGLITGDKPSPYLYIGLGLLFVSLFLVNIEKKGEEKKISFKWIIFLLLAFFGNGLCSTVQKAQQDVFDLSSYLRETGPRGKNKDRCPLVYYLRTFKRSCKSLRYYARKIRRLYRIPRYFGRRNRYLGARRYIYL